MRSGIIFVTLVVCLFGSAAAVKMTMKPSTSIAQAIAVAEAQATVVSPAAPATATASASASAVASVGSRKTMLPSVSDIRARVDQTIADIKAKIDVQRKALYDKVYHQKYTCYDLKDDMCPAIDDYEYCGYCITTKYPTLYGYGLEYEETYKVIGSKKGGDKEYEKVITPKGHCDGEFIYAGKYCPTCEKALKCLVECSGVDVKKAEETGILEIKESCFDECKVTEDDLIACGYVEPPKPPAKKVPVVVTPAPKKTPVVVHPKPAPKPAPAATVAIATAEATATSG
eukprot:TRINITY_DN847_c2_g1_i1.p2 TRINITY_DN847_c2_g1~~TRINITY_DN847_c2_g1_i1.p2  ORF type:complete len:286 (-),score=49.23 TRINITY_DN847_c2_g1_i1:376-1233(-)